MKITGFYGVAAVMLMSVVILAGCGTSIKYSYDARTSFPELKTYQWAKANRIYRQDPLLETNVQNLADQNLLGKGLVHKPDKADLIVWMSYEFDYSSYSYLLRMLTLNIARADNNELVWRGTATGDIKTDAASKELRKAVDGILRHFPPK